MADEKHSRFVDEYLLDLNATQAAIRAGYSPDTAKAAGHNLLQREDIQIELSRKQSARRRRTRLSQDRVVMELARIAYSDIRNLFRDDGSLKAPKEMTPQDAAAISSIETDEIFAGKGEQRVHIGYTRRIKFWDKLSALDKLGKHLGMWQDRMGLEAFLGLFPGPIADRLREYLGKAIAGQRDPDGAPAEGGDSSSDG